MHPKYTNSLAIEVVQSPAEWVGTPSVELVRAFLCGAETRTQLVGTPIERHRIWGPALEPRFDEPFLAATGHPLLSINCFTALDLVWFDRGRGLLELASAMLAWEAAPTESFPLTSVEATDFFPAFFRRPGLYCGGVSGEHLFAFLAGMTKGGDWLGIPKSPDAAQIFAELGRSSVASYGSPFAAFRVYNDRPEDLIEKARKIWETLPVEQSD